MLGERDYGIGDREGVLTFFDDVELEYPRLAVDWDSIRKTILSQDFLQVTFFGGGTIGPLSGGPGGRPLSKYR